MVLFSVFLLSFASLAFEVLLARMFSIGQWNHLSFMVISIALFGFGASGTFLSVLDARQSSLKNHLLTDQSHFALHFLFSVTALGGFISVNLLPLDYFRIILEPVQSVYLLLGFLLLSIPFFLAGLVIAIGYVRFSDRIGQVYCASMTGSAAGALFPICFVSLLGEERLLILSVFSPLILFFSKLASPYSKPVTKTLSRHRSFYLWLKRAVWALCAAGLLLIVPEPIRLIKVQPSDYKSLRQHLRMPESHIVKTYSDIRGRLDILQSPYIRYAPGLSLKFQRKLPKQTAIFKDGDHPFVLYELTEAKDHQFVKYLPASLGYDLVPQKNKVLLISQNGGSGIPSAMAIRPLGLTVLKKNPKLAALVQQFYQIPLTNSDVREYLLKDTQSYDVIHIENWGTTLPGSSALNQEYDFTLEAFKQYLLHLSDHGVLMISRKLLLPPSDSLRIWATAFESLQQIGKKHPAKHIVLFRNWDVYTICIFKKPVLNQSAIKRAIHELNYDLVFMAGIHADEVNRFNRYDQPFHYKAIHRLATAYQNQSEKHFFDQYQLDVRPQTDDRPYPGRLLKWHRLDDLYRSTGKRAYSLLLSGEIVIAVVFIEAILISVLLLVLPLFFVSTPSKKIVFSQFIYFTGIGAGFIFIEIFFIQHFTLLFGDPVISFAVVLGGILSASGAGGIIAQRLDSHSMPWVLLCLILLLIVILAGSKWFLESVLGWAFILKYGSALMVLFATGFLMGIPFTLGMRYLALNLAHKAYAWATNGCASVVGSILAAQLAISFGISAIAMGAMVAYLGVLLSLYKTKYN
jgi:hypothetical protein